MYWSYKSLPELAGLPPKERDAMWREAKRDPFRPADVAWFALFTLVIGCTVVCFIPFTGKMGWAGIVAFLALISVGGRLMDALLILRYRPVVRRLRNGG